MNNIKIGYINLYKDFTNKIMVTLKPIVPDKIRNGTPVEILVLAFNKLVQIFLDARPKYVNNSNNQSYFLYEKKLIQIRKQNNLIIKKADYIGEENESMVTSSSLLDGFNDEKNEIKIIENSYNPCSCCLKNYFEKDDLVMDYKDNFSLNDHDENLIFEKIITTIKASEILDPYDMSALFVNCILDIDDKLLRHKIEIDFNNYFSPIINVKEYGKYLMYLKKNFYISQDLYDIFWKKNVFEGEDQVMDIVESVHEILL